MNKERLLECFTQLKGKAASGIDTITKEHYAIHLEANLDNLVERLDKMAYKPQPVLRVYIPKAGSQRKRPLGIPALEDKLVQAGLVKILQVIYEQDFLDDSYGFRPLLGCHDALRALSQTVEGQPVHYMVEVDILATNDFARYALIDERWICLPVCRFSAGQSLHYDLLELATFLSLQHSINRSLRFVGFGNNIFASVQYALCIATAWNWQSLFPLLRLTKLRH